MNESVGAVCHWSGIKLAHVRKMLSDRGKNESPENIHFIGVCLDCRHRREASDDSSARE